MKMLGHPLGTLFKPLIHSGLRLGLTLVIVLMVISSPIVVLVNPALAKTASPSTLPTISTIPSAPSTIGQDGREGDFTTQAALTSPSSKQTNNIVNTQSEFAVTFTTATTGVIKKVIVTFPVGTGIGSVNLLITREGIGPGTATKTSSTTITYTVNSAVSVPAGTKIKLEFGTIVNSPNPGNSFVTVQTRTAANTIIDGPTSIGFNLKQIGTDDMADNSITSTKPAESFMKKVTVFDDTAGNAIGWKPDGVITRFEINEPLAQVGFGSSVIVNVFSGVSDQVCTGTATAPPGVSGIIEVVCVTAPLEGAILDYTIINLPPNIVT